MNALNDRVTPARQMEVLQAIYSGHKRHGYIPSIREIGDAVGLRSTSTVHYHMTGLADRELIRWDKGKNRAAIITEAGYAELGQPDPATSTTPAPEDLDAEDREWAIEVLIQMGISATEYADLAKAVR